MSVDVMRLRRTLRPTLPLIMIVVVACSGSSAKRTEVSHARLRPGSLVVVAGDGSVYEVGTNGHTRSNLGRIPGNSHWVDSADISSDRRLVYVSSVRALDDQPCVAVTYELSLGRTPRKVFAGGSIAFSPDGRHLAYFRYSARTGSCSRDRLVLRDLRTDRERSRTVPGGPALHDNPPSWPVNWSSDSRDLTFVANRRVYVMSASNLAAQRTSIGKGDQSRLAPVFSGKQLLVNDNCCIGSQRFVRANALKNTVAFSVPAAIRSVRPDDHNGLWVATESGHLYHWDGKRVVRVRSDVSIVGA